MLRTVAIALALFALVAGNVQAETPRRGGTIRYTAPYGTSFASMDIHTAPNVQDEIWSRAIHRTLYVWDSKLNRPRLELATAVTASDDGRVHTYKLRKDAFFHNGRRMTADDIIWSYTRIMNGYKAFPGAQYIRLIEGALDVEKGLEREISGLRKIDDFTLEITFTGKVDPAYTLRASELAIYPADVAMTDSFRTHPIGLGPFKFVEYVPGSHLVAERWEKYYRPGKPYADRLVISIMGDAAARDLAFRNDEIDATVLEPAQYAAYKADPELSKSMIEVAEMFTRYMAMNPRFPPFSDKRVRQAINHAIDSDLIIRTLGKGKAYRATGWLGPSSPAWREDLDPYPYDPDKARELLDASGFRDGFTFELLTTKNASWGLPVVEAMLPMLAKVGIEAKVRVVDGSVLSEIMRAGRFQAFMWSSESGPDPLTALLCFHSKTPQTTCNFTDFSNITFDTLLDKAAAIDDPDRRNDLLAKANAVLLEQAPVWFFNYNKAVMAHQPWLHGLLKNPTELTIQPYEDLWVDATSPAAN